MCIIAQTWPGAQALPSAPVIAVDSEFHHATTLTVQTAMRIDSQTLALQVYRSASIPGLPGSFDQNQYLPMSSENYGRFCSQILLRPVKLLTSDLSPGRMMCDL